jgi:phosphoribosyl 1,2-cyclic phosphodiesterase
VTLTVRFWGVRGSIAVPGPGTVRYGGNTSCIEVRAGDRLFILDAGTGLRSLGTALLAEGKPIAADMLFTHTHIDHVCGIPFFAPFYIPGNKFQLWYGGLSKGWGIETALRQIMQAPMFPVALDIFKADLSFRDFHSGDPIEPEPGFVISTAPLNHPGGATGFRIEHGGRSLAYVTDTEHRPPTQDQNIIALARGVDLLIYDSTYTDEEFPRYVGWGHSTWQEAIRVAKAAGAKKLALFHHDPSHDDGFMDKVGKSAERDLPGTLVAREGMEVKV